ncbi:MAG: hypothetical protein P1U58_13875 [Verrucomicrobiales bacterium]|nr:hypothetical protein [Verrucomicrobiales bacterium]
MKWIKSTSLVQIKYPDRYRYLDIAGETSDAVVEKFGDLVLERADPQEAILQTNDGLVRYIFGVSNARVHAEIEKDWHREFNDNTEFFFDFVFKQLKVSYVNFFGNRTKYIAHFPDREEAHSELRKIAERNDLGTPLLEKISDDRLANQKLDSFRFQFSDENLNIDVTLSVAKRELQIKGPSLFMLKEEIPSEEHYLTLDFDIRTIKTLPVDQVDVQKFMESNHKLISTRLLPLFE